MINKIFFTLALILYTAKGFSQDYIEDFFSSSPEQIVTLTESRDFLIGGIIHPLSGQPCLRQLDLVARGAQNLDLKRIFIPFYIPLNEHNGRINPSKSSYGGWVYFPHTHLNVFKKGKTKGKKNLVTETIVSVSDSQGAVFSYQIDKRGNTKLKTKPWGVCNGVDDQPSGIYDPRNTSISVEGKNVSLQAPDGTKRYYYCSDYYELTINKEAYVCNYCLLQKEVLSNGKVLRYQYNSERQVIKVESLDPTEAYVYATLEIDAPLKGIQATVSTNTGLQASYGHDTGSYFKNDKNGRYIDLLYPLHFTNVNSPNFKNELLNYYKNSNGDSILTKYSGRHPIFKCKSRFFPSKNKNEKNPWVVVDLSLPSGTEAFSRVYSMQYVVGVPGETNSETTVTHSDGIKTIYTFNPQMLPEKVSEYDQQGSLVKEKTFKWMANQWLQSISISDEQQVLSEKKFQYDAFGNPISEILTGDLTGNSQTGSYEIKRTFSTDRRNLLLSEEHSNGKVICYTYLPETNLLTSCLVKENGSRCLSREFRRYDSYNNLIQVVYDNGSAENVDELTGVSERKIIHHLLRQQQPFLHMPEYIEVKYLENGCEKLLKRTHLVYDQWGNVSQEHVHDAELL